jgi:cytochrome c553
MIRHCAVCLVFAVPLLISAGPDVDFAESIRPALVENCSACHNPNKPRNPVNFLKAQSAHDVETDRGVWRKVAAQLRNRTMPPVASKLSEEDRLRIATWVDNQLRQSACNVGDYAGAAAIRRLNRREYHNTVRDLLGVDFDVSLIFPADGTGGAGFDTNGETLFVPPVLMERYLEAAQQIMDRVIVTPPLSRTFTPTNQQIPTGEGYSAALPVYLDGDYNVQVKLVGKDPGLKLALRVDGVAAGSMSIRTPSRANAAGLPLIARLQVHLTRGEHVLAIAAADIPAEAISVTVDQQPESVSSEKRALHYRLLGTEPGEEPLQPRKAARQVLSAFLPKAFRRPVESTEIDRFVALYDRAAERGDPYTERMKLALRAILVWPDFLFRIERRNPAPGIHPLGSFELASRLSYFLWSSPPDERLLRLADQNRLQDPAVLSAEVDRLLDSPRSRTFVDTFVGQWLGTQDLGGRAAPLLTELQSYYTPDTAADLRTEPILLFDHILGENRSLLELLTADYTFLTERLVKFYQLEGKVTLQGAGFQKVKWPDDRRAGVIEMGSVLAITSHYKQTSPVLRGAWTLETLLGTPVPPPPPNVPPLDADKQHEKLSVRQRLERHRADPACSACHNLMDPIGFALENFDWMGRWREQESNGQPLDTTGTLPSGEKFAGPVELRQALLNHKDDFLRQLTAKVLGYALGRSLQDGDSCTVQRLLDSLAKDGYRARTLIREVALSIPFRNTQGGVINIETAAPPPKRQKPLVTK